MLALMRDGMVSNKPMVIIMSLKKHVVILEIPVVTMYAFGGALEQCSALTIANGGINGACCNPNEAFNYIDKVFSSIKKACDDLSKAHGDIKETCDDLDCACVHMEEARNGLQTDFGEL